MKIEPIIDNIKDSILKFVPARRIYLFGSHAYGNPTEESDIEFCFKSSLNAVNVITFSVLLSNGVLSTLLSPETK